MTINELPDVMTLKETADFLRVSVITLKRWDKSNHLIAIRVNSRGDRRYEKKEVLKLLEKK